MKPVDLAELHADLVRLSAAVAAMPSDIRLLRHQIATGTPRPRHRRTDMLRQLAAATSAAPASWAAAAELALMLETGEAPDGCADVLDQLRADPKTPRSPRRIFENIRE